MHALVQMHETIVCGRKWPTSGTRIRHRLHANVIVTRVRSLRRNTNLALGMVLGTNDHDPEFNLSVREERGKHCPTVR